jgi:hypothetical protein
MYARLCAGPKLDGTACRAVAVAGSNLCFHHRRLRQRTRRLQRVHCTPATRLGSLDNRRAILRALSRVTHAIASGSLPLERAAPLLSRIRLASENPNLNPVP